MNKDIVYPNWINTAEKLYKEENLPYYKIAEIVGANRKTVSYYLRLKGYKSNPKYVREIDPEKLCKYKNKNRDIFEKIDNEEKAYWLGLLYADGNVSDSRNSIELSLKEEDYNHIVKFKNFLGAENKIRKKIKNMNGKQYIAYGIGISDAKIKNDLINLGCCPRKTKIITFPTKNQVPDEFIRHFVRGYFDGDGCISHGSTSKVTAEILGTEEFLTGYSNWTGLHKNKINSFKHSNIRRVIYSGPYAMIILNKMYKNSSIYLDRKYELYKKFATLFGDE